MTQTPTLIHSLARSLTYPPMHPLTHFHKHTHAYLGVPTHAYNSRTYTHARARARIYTTMDHYFLSNRSKTVQSKHDLEKLSTLFLFYLLFPVPNSIPTVLV